MGSKHVHCTYLVAFKAEYVLFPISQYLRDFQPKTQIIPYAFFLIIYLNLILKVQVDIYLQLFFIFSHKVSLKSIDVLNIILSPLSRSKFLSTNSIQANISWCTLVAVLTCTFADRFRVKNTLFFFANQSRWTKPVIIVTSWTGWKGQFPNLLVTKD